MTLEHGTSDVPTLDEMFYQDVYEPPPGAAGRLDALGHPARVLDLGANIGLFGIWAQRRLRLGHITAVEPMPRNVALLAHNLSLNRPPGTYSVIDAAACTAEGPVAFGGGSHFTLGRVESGAGELTVRGLDAFSLMDDIDLLKLDIEGGEWPILQDPRLKALTVPVVMLEHHPYGAPGDPARSSEELLAAAGYRVERTLEEADGTGIVWGVKGGAANREAGQAAEL